MAKKYLITLNDEEQNQLRHYMEYVKQQNHANGITINVTETGILKGIILYMLQDLNKP